MPKEPRQRDNRGAKNSGDTVTRNIVISMVALVVLSGVIFTVLDKRSGSETALPASIESIDASNNGAPLKGEVLPENDYGITFNSDASLSINIWEDFQCPFCKFFEDEMDDNCQDVGSPNGHREPHGARGEGTVKDVDDSKQRRNASDSHSWRAGKLDWDARDRAYLSMIVLLLAIVVAESWLLATGG